MGRNWIIGAAAAFMMTTGAAQAFDISSMTEEEEAAFGDAVREYILANPEIIMEAISILEAEEAEAQAEAERLMVEENRDALFNDGHSHIGGNPDGDVTLVEFLDYRCGYCRRAHPEVKQLSAFDGNIRIITKEFPILGEESVLASRFAVAVLQTEGDDAYADVNDTMMQFRGQFTEETLRQLSDDRGFDTDAIMAAMNTEAVTDVLRKNSELAQALAITGTPTFVFGDQLVRGYIPLEAMLQVVEDVRADG